MQLQMTEYSDSFLADFFLEEVARLVCPITGKNDVEAAQKWLILPASYQLAALDDYLIDLQKIVEAGHELEDTFDRECVKAWYCHGTIDQYVEALWYFN